MAVVYDQTGGFVAGGGEHDFYDNGFSQEIGAGNIVVHAWK